MTWKWPSTVCSERNDTHTHTHSSSVVSRGSVSDVSCSTLAWSLLRRMMSHSVWDAFDCVCEHTNTFMNICLHSYLLIYIYKTDLNIFVAWGPFRYQDQKPSITIIHRCFTLGFKLLLCRCKAAVTDLTVDVRMYQLNESLDQPLFIQPLKTEDRKHQNKYTQACL